MEFSGDVHGLPGTCTLSTWRGRPGSELGAHRPGLDRRRIGVYDPRALHIALRRGRTEIDVVYIVRSRHPSCGRCGGHCRRQACVLIEKHLASTAIEWQKLADAARAAGVCLMEAMWSRDLPQASVITTLLADGAFGQIREVLASHGQGSNPDPEHRLSVPSPRAVSRRLRL